MVISRAQPMYQHTDIYWPLWWCCRCIVSAILAHKCCAVALHGLFKNPSCYFVSDPDWLTQMLCPVPSLQSLDAYRTLCNSPDKTLYDVTFAHRFWRGKQMIVCVQTRLRAFVLVGCFTKVSRLDSLVISVHQKSAYVTASRTQVCAEFDVVWFFIAVKWWF